MNEPAKKLPICVFDAPPPYRKRIVTMMIEIDESAPNTTVSIIFAGDTYAYKDRLTEQGVDGGRLYQEDVLKGTYYRLMRNLDVSLEENQEKVVKIIERVFDSLVMRVKLSGPALPQQSDTEAIVDNLERGCPN